jgi:hypothetical protein
MLDLGEYKGRLGNQLFQFAMLYMMVKLGPEGSKIAFPAEQDPTKRKDYALSCFPKVTFDVIPGLKCTRKVTARTYYNYEVDKYILNELKVGEVLNVEGFFLSYPYFHQYRKEIVSLYKFPSDMKRKCQKFLQSLDSVTVSIHVRRGDYVRLSYEYVVVDANYVKRCMEYIRSVKPNKMLTFVVFSDDLDWCRANLTCVDNKMKLVFSPMSNQQEDLCCMSMCHHNIIAASTFSWWGAYLNKNKKKIVMTPARWHPVTCFKGRMSLEHLLLPDWIKM